MFSLNGKVALVTGCSKGIGGGIAIALAEAGASVVVSGKNLEAIEEIEKKICNNGGNAISVKLDVTNEVDIDNALQLGLNKYGRLDILVNNAAVNSFFSAIQLPMDDWDKVFNVNIRSLFICSQKFSKLLISRQKPGSIINVSSNAGKIGFMAQTHYNASKSAVISITQSLSKELAQYNINVNAVCPGAVDTDMLHNAMLWYQSNSSTKASIEDLRKNWAPPQLGRLISPIEIGRVVAFLASDLAQIIRGQALNLDAGITFT